MTRLNDAHASISAIDFEELIVEQRLATRLLNDPGKEALCDGVVKNIIAIGYSLVWKHDESSLVTHVGNVRSKHRYDPCSRLVSGETVT